MVSARGRRKRALGAIILILLILPLFPQITPIPVSGAGANWLTGWGWRKAFNVTERSGSPLTDFTTRIVVGRDNITGLEWGNYIRAGIVQTNIAWSSRGGIVSLGSPRVMRDPETMEPVLYNGVYWASLLSRDGGGGTSGECDIYNSTDLLTWTEHARNIISEPGGDETQFYSSTEFMNTSYAPEPFVIFYTSNDAGGRNRQFAIYSNDMTSWTKSPNNPQNEYTNNTGGWATEGVEVASIVKVDPTARGGDGREWLMVFEGENSAVDRQGIGIAYTSDLDLTSGNWVTLGRTHDTCQEGILREVDPWIWKSGDYYSIWYEIFPNSGGERPAGLMEAHEEDIFIVADGGWNRSESNPVLASSNHRCGSMRAYTVNGTLWLPVGDTENSENPGILYVSNLVALNGHVKGDYEDVRFTSSDGETLLDHVMIFSNSEYAIFEVELDSLAANGVGNFYLYYGNPSASDSSDLSAVWSGQLFWDFFDSPSIDTQKWNITGVDDGDVFSQIQMGDDNRLYSLKMTDSDTDTGTLSVWSGMEAVVSGGAAYNPPDNGFRITLFGVHLEESVNLGQAKIGVNVNDDRISAPPYMLGMLFNDAWTTGWGRKLGYWEDNQDADSSTNFGGDERFSVLLLKDIDNTVDGLIGAGLDGFPRFENKTQPTALTNLLLKYGGHTNNNYNEIIMGSAFLVEQYIEDEPLITYWDDQISFDVFSGGAPPSGGSNAVLGAYSMDNWDGVALYTSLGQDSVIFTFRAEDPDGADTITLAEFGFFIGESMWSAFSYDPSEEGNMPQWGPWAYTDGSLLQFHINVWPLGDYEACYARVSGTSWEANLRLGIWEDTYETTNIQMYGRITSGGQRTDWTLLDGPVWHILEAEGDDDGSTSGSYSPPGDDDSGSVPVSDLDTDGDGVPDATDSDIDGDGIPNWDDDDIDGDGIPNEEDDDLYSIVYDQDTDDDGIPDYMDPDIDGDGIPNEDDGDMDGDGIPNDEDDDTFTDVPPVYINPTEPAGDTDGDGLLDDVDPDIDGDGIPNERDTDMDGDGLSNNEDPDLDGDGVPNSSDWGPYDPSDRRSGAETYGIQIGRAVYAVESIWIRQNGSSVIIMLIVLAFLMWTQDDETNLTPKKKKRANGKSLVERLKT